MKSHVKLELDTVHGQVHADNQVMKTVTNIKTWRKRNFTNMPSSFRLPLAPRILTKISNIKDSNPETDLI